METYLIIIIIILLCVCSLCILSSIGLVVFNSSQKEIVKYEQKNTNNELPYIAQYITPKFDFDFLSNTTSISPVPPSVPPSAPPSVPPSVPPSAPVTQSFIPLQIIKSYQTTKGFVELSVPDTVFAINPYKDRKYVINNAPSPTTSVWRRYIFLEINGTYYSIYSPGEDKSAWYACVENPVLNSKDNLYFKVVFTNTPPTNIYSIPETNNIETTQSDINTGMRFKIEGGIVTRDPCTELSCDTIPFLNLQQKPLDQNILLT